MGCCSSKDLFTNETKRDVVDTQNYLSKNNDIDTKNINNHDNNSNNKDVGKENEIKVEYKNKINLIYFTKSKGTFQILGEYFVFHNKDNVELIINGEPNKLVDKCELKEGENNITLIIKTQLDILSCMFSECSSLKDISELRYLDISQSKNIYYMFYGCSSLSDIKALFFWKVINIDNFKSVFSGCSSLSDIEPLMNWNVSNVTNFGNMFHKCSSLSNIKALQKWNVSNGTNFNGLFYECTLLSDITPLQIGMFLIVII